MYKTVLAGMYNSVVYSKKSIIWLVVLSTLIFFVVLFAPAQYSHYRVVHYTAWHALVECFSVAVSASIFSVMWQAHIADNTKFRLNIVSISFLAVAILDTAHMLSFKGMPQWITESGEGKGIAFWLFARYAAAFSILILVIPACKKLNIKYSIKLLLAMSLIYTAVPFLLVFAYPNFPLIFIVPGKGLTPFKIGLEWGVIVLLVIALVINATKKQTSDYYDPGMLNLAIYLGILSELCFTLYSNVTGVFSVLGHLYKIGAYFFLYQGIAVTSLKLPFRQMARQQDLLQQITSSIKQIFLLSSRNRDEIFYVSPAFEEISEYSIQELMKTPGLWYEMIHPDDRDGVVAMTKNIGAASFTHEFRIFTATGKEQHLSESIYPILNDDGTISRIASVCDNVTHKKILVNALANSERMLNNVINSIPLLVGYWDKDLRNIFANHAYAKWTGCESEEIKGRHIKELFGDDTYKRILQPINGVMSGESQQFERNFTTPDGKVHRVLANYVPDISQGEVVGFFTTVLDITTIKNVNEKLKVSEDRLLRSQIIGHIGSWEVNIQSGQAWWSEENYKIYGVNKNTVLDMHTAFDLVHPSDREELLAIWDKALKNHGTFSHEHKIITQNEQVKYVWEFAEITLDSNGEPYLIAGCTQDITERKQAEIDRESLQNQLMQSQKMESIGHLTGGVAHDFNNMLGAILGYTELLRQILNNNQDNSGRIDKYLSEILTAGNRAKELISQMLVFSRSSPGPDEETPNVLIQPIIKEVVSLLKSSIPATISINYHVIDQSLKARIHPIQLHQILLNLVINARDAITEYGRIDITVVKGFASGHCKSCHQDFNGEFIDLTVHDDGNGIAQDLKSNIFDPFYSTKEVGKGTGMGLSVVHGIVHSAGGHIDLISEIERGSAFRILLPCPDECGDKEEPAGDESIKRNQPTLQDMRIMVIDDEQAMTALLTDMLALQGAQVCAFNRSSEALSDFLSHPDAYDLIITDETMPELTGLDMSIAMLRKRKDLPIILCTGFSDNVNVKIAIENGLSAFMQKPIKMEELVSEIIRVTQPKRVGEFILGN